jgi:hypothetical protein
VAGDRPDALTAGEFNLWETIAERVQSAHLPPIACVIHAGGNVYLKQVEVFSKGRRFTFRSYRALCEARLYFVVSIPSFLLLSSIQLLSRFVPFFSEGV